MNKIDLNGRCAVVTGGAQGFGRAITERFVSSGAKVAIWDMTSRSPRNRQGNRRWGHGVQGRRLDLAAVEKTKDATLKAFARSNPRQQCRYRRNQQDGVETDLEEWRKVLRINLDGPFICCKAIVPSMVKQNYGRIVNIASIAAK